MEKTLSRNATRNWDLSFTKLVQVNMPDPYGANIQINESADMRNKRKDTALLKQNKAKELAFGQFKTVMMTIISFFFIGSNLSLFTIFIYGFNAYNSLSSVLNVNTGKDKSLIFEVFKMFESPEYSILHYKILYVVINSVSLTFLLYKVYGMGLIPLNPADWVSILDTKVPGSRLVHF